MLGEFSLFVTSVTNAGSHISFHAQLNADKFAALDSLITQHQAHFEQNKLVSPYELLPGEVVLVKSASGGVTKWHRGRVVGLQDIEYGTVSVEYIDYGTSELALFSQLCAARSAVTRHILAQPPLAVPCVLAEVTPALGTWTDAALSFVESKLRGHQPIQAQLLRQDGDGVWCVRVFTGDGNTLASQLVALGLGRLATAGGQFVPALSIPSPRGAQPSLSPSPLPSTSPAMFATRVKELTSVSPPPGSEALVTICHYVSGPAKFAIQLHEQRPALQQLMAEIQKYCQSSPAVPLSAVESGVVCLGSSATREGRFLRGVISQADGNIVKVYWADYGNDETKVASELRAMPRQFAQLRIQASRFSLAGLAALTPVQGRPEPLFRQMTEGSVLKGRFAKLRDPPAAAVSSGAVCMNQVELLDMGISVLDLLVRAGAYERRAGSGPSPSPTTTPVPPVAARRAASPPSSPPPLTPDTHAEVCVVSVTSVSSLHVRPLDTEPLMLQMLERLTDALNVCACPLPADRAVEGVMCAAFKDTGYQRARIVSVGRRDMKVLYVDLGTSEIIPTASAFALEPTLANYPPQAVHCCLSGLEMSHGTPELVQQLRTLTAGGRLLCEVLNQLGEKRIVRLTDLSHTPPLDVGAALRGMMSTGRRVQPSLSSSSPVLKSAPAAVTAVTVRPPEVELGRAELISVVHVESAASFFGQLMSVDSDAMFAMEEAIQVKYGVSVPPLRAAVTGAFCVAKSSIDGTFYRAKVLSAVGDKVAIQFIDYGDKETKAPTEVFPLYPEFAKLSQLGLFCCLAGSETVPADPFCQLVQDQTLEVLPVFGSGDHYRVSLPSSPHNQQLLAWLKPFGVPTTAAAAPKSPAVTNGTATGASPAAAPAPAQAPSVVDVAALQLPIGLFKDVTMAHVVSPSEFYVRLREHSDSLIRLEAELASYGAAPPAPVTIQQTVAVECGDRWYRGRVTERKVDQVSVYLVDSGETVTVPLSSVRLLHSEHARLPAQAVRCRAKGTRPANSSGWTDEETAKFRSGVLERSFLARADEVRGDTALVTLAQAEPVTPAGLLSPATQQPVRPADSNNNSSSKRTSPPPRADQDPNWRDKSTAVPAPSAAAAVSADPSTSTSWRASDSSRPNGGLRVERRLSGGSAPAQPAVRPPRPDPERRAAVPAPTPAPAAAADSEPNLERFAGKMRMDNPAEYARVLQNNNGGRGDAPSGGRPSSRSSNNDNSDGGWGAGDSGKRAAAPAPASTPAPTPARVEIAAHSGTLALRPVPTDGPLAVTPTWVAGLGRFYVQRSPAEPAFTSLMEEMQRFYGGLKPEEGQETEPTSGKPVAAKFTDGGWYRGSVRSSSASELRVLFVDYGNCEMVARRQVKRLKEQHCRLPAQAYCCRFAGVEPVGGEWKALDEKQLAKYFSGDMKVTSVGGSGSVSAVEVTLAGQKVTDLLVADGLAVRPQSAQTLKQQYLGPFRPLPDQFRAGDKVSVFVSYIAGPDLLHCQLSANAGPVEELESKIEAATADCKPVGSAAAAGAGCLAPFDGTFYRGVVVERTGDSASVHFIDYGNTETVPAAELLECPESLSRLPAQAVRLCLTGVPLDRTDDLTARADQMEFVARVDLVSPDHLDVTLFDGETNINMELGGTAPAPASAPASAPAPAPAAATSSKKVTFAPSVAAAPEPAAAAPERRLVAVSFTVSPGELYVQDASAADQLDELMTRLDTEYTQLTEGERTVQEVQSGDLLAAPFSEDGAFYRARVLAASADASQLHLQFIDYGNSEWSALSGCRLLTPPLLAPAPFAQRCRLAGAGLPAGGWTADATAALETLTGAPDGQVQMTLLSDTGDCWTVRLTGIGGEDVSDALLKDGHAVAVLSPTKEDAKTTEEVSKTTEENVRPTEEDSKPTSEDTQSPVEDTQPSAVAGMASLVLGRPVAAAVAFSSGPCEFWAQLLSDSARLDALMEALESAGELPAADSAAAGSLVAVRYAEDGAIYRARVLPDSDSAGSDSRRVLFVDYGNTESVPMGELRCLPVELAAEPPLAVRCSLPLRPAAGAEQAAVERFAELADGELELELTLISAGDPVMVALRHDGRDLAQTMVEEELAVAVETKTQPETEETAGDQAGDAQGEAARAESQQTGGEKEQITGGNQKEIETPASEPPASSQQDGLGSREVFVTHVNSPLEFYIQSPDTAALDELMERLADTDVPLSPPATDPAPSTDLLAAPFSEDEALYRARVLSTSDGRARVLFVDYGNGEEVELSALRQLPDELAALPPQAVRCRLLVEACAAAASDRLRQLTEEGALLTRLAVSADADGPVELVRLTVGGKDVAEALAADGLCRPARRLTLPSALLPPLDANIAVRVTHVEDSGEVYVVPAADATALRELQGMIAELYAEEPPPALASPATDDLCVVQGPDGGDWRRAAVMTVNPTGTAQLRLVDSGATLESPLAQLRQPLQSVSLPPPLAHRCRLAAGPDGPSPNVERVREACRRADGAVTARLSVDEGQLLVHLSIDGGATETAPVGGPAKAGGDVTDGAAAAEVEAPAVPAVPVTPSPGRRCREDKIVPGQISFSLIVPPQLAEDTDDDGASEPAVSSQSERPAEVTDGRSQDSAESTTEVVAPVVAPVGTPVGTPIGRHLSHEYKIVPGQISLSLLTEPESESEVETETTAQVETPDVSKEAPPSDEGVTEAAPEEVTEAAPEEVTETLPEQVAEALLEQVAEALLEQVTAATPEEGAEIVPEEVTETTPKKFTETTQEEVTETTPEEVTETRPEEITEIKSEEVTETRPEEVVTETRPEEITEIKSEEVTETRPEEVTETKPEEVTETKSEEVTETTPEEFTETTQEEATETIPEEATETTPEEATETTPEEATETTPEEVTETMHEEVTETTPKEVTETRPEKITETKPEEVVTGTAPEDVVTETRHGEATETKPEEATETKPEETTETKPEETTETKPEEATETKPEEATETKPEEVAKTKSEEVVTETMPEEVAETKLKQLVAETSSNVTIETTPEAVIETTSEVNTKTTPNGVTTETTPEEAAETKPEEVTETNPEEVVTEATPEDVVTETRPEEASGTKPEEASGTKPEEASGTKPEEASGTKPEEATETKPEETTETNPEEVTVIKPEEVVAEATPEDVVTETSPGVDTEATSELDTEATSEGINTTTSEGFNTTTSEGLNTTTSEEFNTTTSEGLNTTTSEGLNTTSEGLNTTTSEGLNTTSEGSNTTTSEVDTEASSEGDTEITSEDNTETRAKEDTDVETAVNRELLRRETVTETVEDATGVTTQDVTVETTAEMATETVQDATEVTTQVTLETTADTVTESAAAAVVTETMADAVTVTSMVMKQTSDATLRKQDKCPKVSAKTLAPISEVAEHDQPSDQTAKDLASERAAVEQDGAGDAPPDVLSLAESVADDGRKAGVLSLAESVADEGRKAGVPTISDSRGDTD